MVALTAPSMFDDVSGMDPAQLADRRVIAPWQPHFLRQALDGIFLELGVSFVPKLEIDSKRCMIEMAQLGDGTVILPRSCVARELAEGRLKSIPIHRRFQLATIVGQTPGRQQTRAVGILTEVLYDLAAELATAKGWSVADAASMTAPVPDDRHLRER